MRYAREFLSNAMVGGVLVLLPVYLAVLVLLKGMQSVAALVRPLASLVPAALPAEQLLSLLLVLFVCFLVGAGVRTPRGQALREGIEKSLFGRLPGYVLFRSLTQRLAGVPTPLAGAVYILSRERVHPLNIPFTEAIKPVSRWGSGAKDLVAAME
jgi:uncharacterized membrane protein